MQSNLLALLLAVLLATVSVQAQTEKNTEKMRETKDLRSKEMQAKSGDARAISAEKQKAMQQSMKAEVGSRSSTTPNVVSDLKLSADEEKRNINGYKVDFASNPYGSVENAIASISLYSGTAQNQQKVGVIHFYAEGAKLLNEIKSVDDQKMVTLHYDLDGFAAVQDLLSMGNRLALVINNKTKQAYISTDVMPTRTK